jgi:hypothetical protein
VLLQTIGGALDEFIFSPRIDNQLNCYAGLEGLLKGLDTLADDSNVRMLALFDNEEVILVRVLCFLLTFLWCIVHSDEAWLDYVLVVVP